MFAIFAATNPERFGTVWVDWVAVIIMVVGILCLAAYSKHMRRTNVVFSPLRDALDKLEDDHRFCLVCGWDICPDGCPNEFRNISYKDAPERR